ncbi:ABC transporter substrate-binding protein [Bacillus sp. SL00103]
MNRHSRNSLNTLKSMQRRSSKDPDLILLMTHSNPEDVKAGFMSEMKQNAAWHDVSAVKHGQVEILPSDLFGTNPGAETG